MSLNPMPAEFTGIERRHLEHAVDQLERSHSEQQQIVAKLLVISENNASAMTRLEAWVTSHEADYRAVRERLLSQELIGENISQRLETLNSTINTTMQAYLADKNKVFGGWFILAAVGGIIVAASSVLVAAHQLGMF
jgi:hypothetical protein